MAALTMANAAAPDLAGAILLGEIATPLPVIDLACNRCDRRSRLRIAQLVAEHGPDLPVRVQFNRADN